MKIFSIPVLLTASLTCTGLLVSASASNNNSNNKEPNDSNKNYPKTPVNVVTCVKPTKANGSNVFFAPNPRRGVPKDLYRPTTLVNTNLKELFTSESASEEEPITAPMKESRLQAAQQIKKLTRTSLTVSKPSTKAQSTTEEILPAQAAQQIRILTRPSPLAQSPTNATQSVNTTPVVTQANAPVAAQPTKILPRPAQLPKISRPSVQPVEQAKPINAPPVQLANKSIIAPPIKSFVPQVQTFEPANRTISRPNLAMYQQPIPTFFPSQPQFFPVPHASRATVSPLVVIPEVTFADMDIVLPEPLVKAIRSLSTGYKVQLELVEFFNLVQRNASSNFPSVLEFLHETMVRIAGMLIDKEDSQNKDLLVTIDSFLRCYTASFLVCRYDQRDYIMKNGLLTSITNVTYAIRLDDPYKGLKGIFDGLFLDGRITKDKFYHLGISFLKYLKVLKNTQLMANIFHYKFNTYIEAAEKILNEIKNEVVEKNQFVADFADYLSAPRVPQFTRTFPSMHISPFRIYVTLALESYISQYMPKGKSGVRTEANRFWKLTERAFNDFDAIFGVSQEMLLPNIHPKVRQMHLDFIRYYLESHIFANIELAFSRLPYIPEPIRTMMNKTCKVLFTSFFDFEDKRLLSTSESSMVTLAPAISNYYSLDDILSNDPSVLMEPLIVQMEQAHELLVPSSPQSVPLKAFANAMIPIVKFVRFERSYLMREFIKRLSDIARMPYSAIHAAPSVAYDAYESEPAFLHPQPELYVANITVQPEVYIPKVYAPEVYVQPEHYIQPFMYFQPELYVPNIIAHPDLYVQPEVYGHPSYDQYGQPQYVQQYEEQYGQFDQTQQCGVYSSYGLGNSNNDWY